MTHQYVNPLVAIALGSLLLGETLDATTALGALIVIGAVFATIRSESRAAARIAGTERRPGAVAPARGR